jgi:hypothetical protein
MKTVSLIVVLLLSSANSIAQSCTLCAYRELTDTFNCQGTCTAAGGCCCVITVQRGGESCYTGGCCLYNPQSGGLCYDSTGASCGGRSCPGGAVTRPGQMSFVEPLLVAPSDPSVTVLAKVEWIANKDFPDQIRQYSKSFGNAVEGWQGIVAKNPEWSVKEYDSSSKFHMIVRPHFPVEITVTHAGGDDWVIYFDRADTKMEGPRAPIMLEIVGNQWKLVSHQMMHADDKNNEKYVVASGTVQ